MTAKNEFQNRTDTVKSITRAVLLTLPVFIVIWFLNTRGRFPEATLEGVSITISLVFMATIFFLMQFSGKTYKYRKLFFVMVAVCFPIPFISHYIEIRGSMTFNMDEILSSTIPFCHLVIPMIIAPAALTKTIIFPGSLIEGYASISSMLIIWIGASLALGKGWCSWICFYGGWDEGFTYLSKKKPTLKLDKKWTYLPYAVLIVIVLTSAASLSPTYCEWLCPFKAVTEFEAITSIKVLVQTIIFASLFILLVIVLPILTGKRAQCSVLCPFAAFQAFTNKINIFDIRIDAEKCKSCKTCIKTCPTISIDENSRAQGKTRITCTKCGRCVDDCRKDAAQYHIKGTGINIKPELARNLFLYPAFIFGTTIGGGMIAGAIHRILMFVTTGSMI